MSGPSSPQHNWSPPRKHPRYQIDLRLVIYGTQTLHGRTKDISEGGLGATVAGNLKTDEIVTLEFFLPGVETAFKLKAEIRYHKGFHYGFRFLHATEEQREFIREAARIMPLAPVT